MKVGVHKKAAARTSADRPSLLVADKNGEIYDDPRYLAGGMAGGDFVPLQPDDLVPLPEGSKFFFIPKGRPVGFNKKAALPLLTGPMLWRRSFPRDIPGRTSLLMRNFSLTRFCRSGLTPQSPGTKAAFMPPRSGLPG